MKKVKFLVTFILQACIYKFKTKKTRTFREVAKDKLTSTTKAIDPIILTAFKKNKLSCSHHGLLYEQAFNHRKVEDLIIAHFPAEFTDIYQGDFVSADINDYFKKVVNAIHIILDESKQLQRFCSFIDVNESIVKTIDQHQIPLKKFFLGHEWITDIQRFELSGIKSRDFRHAIHRAKRDRLQLNELQEDENLDQINHLISYFSKLRHLSFPRLGAAIVKRYVYHPSIYRRIWKVTNQYNELIAVVTACKTGLNQYFFEHAAYDLKYRANYLSDWCFSQILLQLKQEGVQQISWGKIAHLYNNEIPSNNVDLWIIKKYYQLSQIKQFTLNSMQFKKKFLPITQVPRWALYTDFRAEVLMDIAGMVGY
ncbi:hypothetical protein ACQUW5_00595 [Legionella sp. CNM-1927-20]|uniref:hypothetical protein n=1 Tax=Legionella sp. CNM-1927-20 TaxID=3422221 RepID=UPI00403AE7D9